VAWALHPLIRVPLAMRDTSLRAQAKGALKDAGPEPEAFTFFKQQLWTGIDRLYVTIRDTAKQQLTNILNASHNPVRPRSSRGILAAY